MSQVLGIVYRAITTYITQQAGYTKVLSNTGAVTFIQRFGGAVNLNVHFHMLFLDGVFVENTFKESYAPSTESIDKLTHTIATRVGAYLERQGLLERSAIVWKHLSLRGKLFAQEVAILILLWITALLNHQIIKIGLP